MGGDVIAKGDPGRTTDTSEKEEGEGGCKDGSDDDDDDDDDGDERESSHGEFSVDMDMIDDVTCDEGFELGEVRGLLDIRGWSGWLYSMMPCEAGMFALTVCANQKRANLHY